MIEKGNALMNRQQFQPALATYQQVLDLEPNNGYALTNIVLAHNNWGILYFHQGNYKLAKAEWDKALAIEPNDRNARNNLIVLKRTLAKLGKNIEDLSREDAAKSQEKGKGKEAKATTETPNSPPAAVLLFPQKKQETAESAQSTTGANNSTSYNAQDLKGPDIVSDQAPTKDQPAQIEMETPKAANIVPAKRTRADDELDAFRRMTSPSSQTGAYGGGNSAATPGISSFKPVRTGPVGDPTSFLDDTGASPTQKHTEVEAEPVRTMPRPEPDETPASERSQEIGSPSSETTFQTDSKPTHKKKHESAPAAVSSAPGWTEASSQGFGINESNPSTGNLDFALNKLEIKIYGQPRPQPSVLKRLEHMEIDSFGHAGLGSIADRIDKLKKMYNISD